MFLFSGCVDVWEGKVLRSAMGSHFRVPVITNIPWTHVNNYLPSDPYVILSNNNPPSNSQSELLLPELPDELQQEIDPDTGKALTIDPIYNDHNALKEFNKVPLQNITFDNVKVSSSDNIVLVIGGETHGISLQSHKLAVDHNGATVTIPMMHDVNSLNSATSLAVILFNMIARCRVDSSKLLQSEI